LQSLEYDIQAIEVAAVSNSGGWRRLRNVEGMAIYAAKKNEVIELSGVMGNLAANNAREIYKSIAGLNIWESDGAGLQLAIGARGLDPNRTSSFNTRQNGYDISADALGYHTPPTQALERIEIVRGAASLQYGPQFGGLLNFVMKKGPRDKKIAYTTDNTYGAFGFLSSTHSLGGAVGKLNYYTFYQYRQAEGWRANSEFGQLPLFGCHQAQHPQLRPACRPRRTG
jgi:Fe(3+) dicitrate transport protein